VKTSGPVFDLQKLEWMNGEYIRMLPVAELLERILKEHYTRRTDQPAEKLLKVTALAQERLKRLADFDNLTNFFFEREPYKAEDLVPKKHDPSFAREALDSALDILKGLDDWSAPAMEAAVSALAERRHWERGALFMVLRVAVTCRRVSTPLFETMEILGKQECLERIEAAATLAATLT
jgi:glutamyl-tRNA synthetase